MASVAIIYRKDKLNLKGEAPIHLRIIKDRRINYITAGIMLPQKFWDTKKNKIRSSYPNSARLNSFLANKFAELQDQVFEHETLNKSLTSRGLKVKIYGKKPTDFFAFADQVLAQYLAKGKFSTHIKYHSIISKLKEYHYGRQLMFQDITLAFVVKYENYMRDTWKNKTNSIHNDMKFLRKVFNDAYREDVIEHNQNPFLKYKMKTEKTQRQFLSEEELELIENYSAPAGSDLALHRDMFIFAACAGGVRISDVLQLKWKNFDGTHVNFSMRKTSEQISVKLPNDGLEIINRYKTENISPEKFIFPILSDDLDLNDSRMVYNRISYATSCINKSLKHIGKKVEISKPVTFHISRHSWATRALRKGISIDKVSKLLGHASIRETQIYAKLVNVELDKAMDVFNS